MGTGKTFQKIFIILFYILHTYLLNYLDLTPPIIFSVVKNIHGKIICQLQPMICVDYLKKN